MCKPTTFSSGPTQTSFITFYGDGDGYDGGEDDDGGDGDGDDTVNDNTVCCFLVVKAWYIGVNLVW